MSISLSHPPSTLLLLLFLSIYLLSILLPLSSASGPSEWIYEHQFPIGSETLSPPSIVLFSIYMGKIKYKHLPLLVASMKHNPSVRFNIINIVETLEDAEEAKEVIRSYNVTHFNMNNPYLSNSNSSSNSNGDSIKDFNGSSGPIYRFNHNVHLEALTMSQFREVVKRRLHIDIEFNSSWYYKMCDYKPTLAYLFPHLMGLNEEGEAIDREGGGRESYMYWGFADMDIVWGNFHK